MSGGDALRGCGSCRHARSPVPGVTVCGHPQGRSDVPVSSITAWLFCAPPEHPHYEPAEGAAGGLTFAEAQWAATEGARITRGAWGGGDAWVGWMPPTVIPADLANGRVLMFVTREHLAAHGGLRVAGYFVMWDADGSWRLGWQPTDADRLATDWRVLPGKLGEKDGA